MAQSWEDSKIQELGNKYKQMAAAGAPGDVLNGIHQQAERLRAEMGYSGGKDGSQVTTVSSGSKRKYTAAAPKERVTVIGSADDFDAASYDFAPMSSVTQSASGGGSLDGGTIAGYVITALVLVVILDKLVG